MEVIRRIAILLLVFTLIPILIVAQEIKTQEMKGTVLEKGDRDFKILTKQGEKKIELDVRTKGLEKLKEGSKVLVEFEKTDAGTFRAKNVETTGSIGTRCPCDKCPEEEYCKEEVEPAFRK